MRFEPRRILILFFALLAALPAQATVYQWVGSAGNGNMTGTNANYSPSGAPITGDTISWNATTYTAAPTANGNLTVGELWFGGNNTGNVTFGAGTSVLTLNADGATPGVGIQMDSGSGAVSTSGTKFALGGNQTWLNNSASLLTANGTITNSGNVTGYTLTVDGSGNTTLNGIISNGGTVGTTALTKNGSGTLTLAGNNTYTGPTTIKSGTLKVSTSTASANAFGGNGTIIIGDAANTGAAATLEFNTTLTPGFPTFSNAINIVGNGTSTISALNYSPTFAGNVTLSNNLNILSNNASGSFLIFNGGITGNGNVTVTVQSGSAVGSYVTFNGLVNNNGALTFNNISYSGSKANTIAGGVGPNVTAITQASSNSPLTISGNAIQVNSGGTTLTASGAALFTVSGGITGTGNLTLNTNNNTNGILVTTTAINNVGAVTNSGTGTAATTISSTIGGNVTSVIQNSATSMLILNAANTAWSGGIQINSGTLENLQNATNPLGTGALTLGSAGSDAMLLWATGGGTMTNAITVAAGAGNRTIRTNAASGSLNLNSTINLNGHDLVFDTLNQTGFIIGGTITGSNKISFTNSGNLTGAATSLNLSENSFTGIFEITSGATLKMILNNGATAGTVNVLSGGNFTTTQGVTVTIAGLTGDAGSFTNAAGAKVLTIAGSGTYDFKGLIQDSAGAGGLTMNGTGTQILSGNNTYTGATTVTAGTLRAGVAGTAFGLNSAVSLANTASATLDLNNFSTSIGSLAGGGTTGGNVTLGSGTLTTGGANASTTYNGTISGTGGLIKVGTGNQTLTGSNTYTGGTGVNGGALILDFSTATTNILNSSSALTLGGGTFKLIGKASNTNSQTVNGTTLNAGASALTLAANATANPLLLNLGAITRNVGGTVDFTQPTGTISGTNGFVTSTGNTSGILGGWATVAGTDWATNNGTNIVALPSGNYTANTWAAANNTNVTTSSAPGSDSTTNSLRFNTAGAYTLTLTGTNTITSGGILVTSTVGNNLSTITGGNLQGASGADLVVIQNNITNGLAISSVIQNNTSATGLTKSGSGILTLTNANTYTGLTTIGSGTLQIGSGADAGSIDSTSAIINNGSLVYNVAAGNRTVAVGISGTGSLTQNSTGGTLTLAAANTYTGATTLTTGNLILTGGLSGSSITVGTGTSAANFTQNSTGTIAGAGTTFTLTNGTATLAGANTYTGATTLTTGNLILT
ncbi:MAG: autotransporter-associated beta strand repeat-containing protein, partial [Verrucomicrobiae bacterium]